MTTIKFHKRKNYSICNIKTRDCQGQKIKHEWVRLELHDIKYIQNKRNQLK